MPGDFDISKPTKGEQEWRAQPSATAPVLVNSAILHRIEGLDRLIESIDRLTKALGTPP